MFQLIEIFKMQGKDGNKNHLHTTSQRYFPTNFWYIFSNSFPMQQYCTIIQIIMHIQHCIPLIFSLNKCVFCYLVFPPHFFDIIF